VGLFARLPALSILLVGPLAEVQPFFLGNSKGLGNFNDTIVGAIIADNPDGVRDYLIIYSNALLSQIV